MLLEFVPQYRDETEAASARFTGDAAAPPTARHAGTFGRVAAALAAALAVLLVSTGGRVSPKLLAVLAQADRINHPVFVAGIVFAAVGAAMVLIPLVYLFAQRGSARPVIEQSVRIDLAADVLVVSAPSKELAVEWRGVVAVAETRNLFVLRTLGDLRVVLPKRGVRGFAESQAGVDELRELLRQRVTPMADVARPEASAPGPVPPPRMAA